MEPVNKCCDEAKLLGSPITTSRENGKDVISFSIGNMGAMKIIFKNLPLWDNHELNFFVRQLHEAQLSGSQITTKENDEKMMICLPAKGQVKTKIVVPTQDWKIIQKRVGIRTSCSDFEAIKITADRLYSVFGDLMEQLCDNVNSGSKTTTIIDVKNQRSVKLEIDPKVMIEALIDVKDRKRAIHYHCTGETD
ncbi:Hypothetical protein POVR1_LOCUS68 [uncultured virus]|nr:Hypothetical protein POVR1_LOCUS68 [uncultured virus]